MSDKKHTYVYSEEASKKYGSNLITLKDGKEFYTTAILETANYNDDSYNWKDKKVIHECFDSEVKNNQPTEHAHLVDNYTEKHGYHPKGLTVSTDKILEIREKNKAFNSSNNTNKYKKLL